MPYAFDNAGESATSPSTGSVKDEPHHASRVIYSATPFILCERIFDCQASGSILYNEKLQHQSPVTGTSCCIEASIFVRKDGGSGWVGWRRGIDVRCQRKFQRIFRSPRTNRWGCAVCAVSKVRRRCPVVPVLGRDTRSADHRKHEADSSLCGDPFELPEGAPGRRPLLLLVLDHLPTKLKTDG